MVKSLPIDFNESSLITESKLTSLVPMEIHELSSLYRFKRHIIILLNKQIMKKKLLTFNFNSLEKDKLLNKIKSSAEVKNEKLNEFLSALNIDVSKLNNQHLTILPKNLLECCASLSTRSNLLTEIPKIMGGKKTSNIF